MNENSLRANLADLAQEIRLLGDRIRAVAPSPLDEVGRPAPFVYRRSSVVPRGAGALAREPFSGGALGSGLEAVKPGGLTYWDSGAPPPPRDLGTSPINVGGVSEPLTLRSGTTDDRRRTTDALNSRVLRHIEDRSLADWISAEVLAYDRKELREAVAKLRDMFRKLLEDAFRKLFEQALGLGHWALGSGSGLLTSHFSPLTAFDRQLTTDDRRVLPDPFTSHFSPLTNQALGSESGLLTSRFSPQPAFDRRGTTDDRRTQEVHFHIHDAAAVAPILRNKNAMLVRTAALIDQQRALTRRPRGR